MSLITVSSEDPVFVKENLFDRDFSNPFRFNSLTGGTIEIDFLQPVTFDSVFIGNHNFTPAASVTIKVGVASPPTTLIDTPAFRAKNIISLFATQSFRFLEVGIADGNSVLTEIGELVVGLKTTLPRAIRFGKTPGIRQDVVTERTNRGKRYALELFRLENRSYTIRFLESERQQVLDFWEAVEGSLDPFVWIENQDEPDPADSLYVTLEEPGFFPKELTDPAPDAVFDWAFKIIEEGLGAAIEE